MTSLIKRLLPGQMHFFDADDLEETTFLLYVWSLEILPTRDIGKRIDHYQSRGQRQIVWDEPTRELFSRARANLFTSFDVVRLKLATFKAMMLCLTKRSEVEALFARENLPPDCADLYLYLLRDGHFWPLMRERLRAFSDPLLMQDMTLDPSKLVQECYEDFKQYKVHKRIGHEAWRKLSFVADSNNETLDSIEQELKLNAVSYYYKVRPFRGRLYATNYAKSSVGGKINQMIAYWTNEDRARLRQETGTWSNPGNSVIISTSTPEMFERSDHTWAQMVLAA